MHACKSHQIQDPAGGRDSRGEVLLVCDFCCWFWDVSWVPTPLALGAVAPQLPLLFGAWGRGGSKSSLLVLLAQKEILSQQVRIDDFAASATCLSSRAGGWGPSWRQASARGTALKLGAWCLSPAVFFGIPVPLQSRTPLASEMS